ncbi:CBS domain-containing protein [Escherichia coli]|uniref:CBS domain-containing protein n=2 Tax=Bacteria TaxID=2 RepID=UPI003B9E6643
MGRRGVRRLVLIDEAGRLVGVVSRSDLLRGFLRTDDTRPAADIDADGIPSA